MAVQHRGTNWTPEEDRRLLDLIEAGKSWVFIFREPQASCENYSRPHLANTAVWAKGEGEIARVRFVSLSLPNKRSLCRGAPRGFQWGHGWSRSWSYLLIGAPNRAS